MSFISRLTGRIAKTSGQPQEGPSFINVIQTPDLGRKLVTRYGLREKSPAPTLASEVVPVVLVDDLVGESDLIRPRIRPCGGGQQLATVAQTLVFGLRNPVDSGVIVHLFYFSISGTVSTVYRMNLTGTPALGSPLAGSFRNGLFPAQAPAAITHADIAGVNPGGGILGFIKAGTTTPTIMPMDVVIDEGQQFYIRQAAATTMTAECAWVWSEEDKK